MIDFFSTEAPKNGWLGPDKAIGSHGKEISFAHMIDPDGMFMDMLYVEAYSCEQGTCIRVSRLFGPTMRAIYGPWPTPSPSP